ncbi:unnamed protein product [Prorocentrum cordatum]|uniref:MMS19 nucleotide excision repair protein n=1 Tax=Prorocentrum cordatum TaxID=2364126 RepID=A0ABN9TUB0_9DINO|nr:unnamed protein product [Polarella glacialis]
MAVAGGAPSADAAGPTDLVELLAALMPLAAALPPTGAGASAVDGIDEALHDACAVGALLLSEALRPAEVPPGELLLGVLELLGTAPGARGGACHLELLATLTECVAARAQALGPAGVASCLHAVARSRALASLGSSRAAAGSTAAEAAAAACRRARAFCGMPEEPATAPGPGAGPGAPSRLPPAASELLRALLLWDRRLSAAEAARGAHFCALALDCPAFGEEERGQARAGLSQLLRRLSWERRRWSPEDRGLIASVGALLRSEFPELLRPPFAGRSVLAMLEELRGERTVTAAANAPIGRST